MKNKNLYKNRNIVFIISILLLLFQLAPALGQYAQAPDLETALQWQDQQVLLQLQNNFLRDYRYEQLLSKILQKLNLYVGEVYPGHNKNIYCYVFASNIGFNAITWHRIIVFDSLLIDSVKRLAEGIVVYGDLNNGYINHLTKSVASLDKYHKAGNIYIDLQNQENPFHLPKAHNLTPEQQQESQKLFEDIIASWVAHEGSHAFLNHVKEKAEVSQTMAWYNEGKMPPEILNQYIGNYLNYTLAPQKELEADSNAVILLLKSGYSTDGFIDWLKFADILEELSGSKSSPLRTHPKSEDRIRNIKETEEKYLKQLEKQKESEPEKSLVK